MNYLDAIKSSLPYRRKSWRDGRWREAILYDSDWKIGYTETFQDLTADDWEVEEPTLVISRQRMYEQFAKALKASGEKSTLMYNDIRFAQDIFDRVVNGLIGEVSHGPTNNR